MASNFIVETSNPAEFPPHNSFDDMEGIPESLLRGIYAFGFEKPSPIQSVSILPILRGRDLLAQAQSGTGKTGAFGIGLLSRLDMTLKKPQALVMAPTRELAEQIASVIRGIGAHMKVGVSLSVGGAPRNENVREIRSGACQVVVGTPGRVFDLASNHDLPFDSLRVLVLDEADVMLIDKFAEQVHHIFNIGLPDSCSIALFSATMPKEVRELADKFLKDPVHITLKTEDVKLDGIKQYYVALENDSHKIEVFQDIFESLTIQSSIVFCNSKERAERLSNSLRENGFPVSVIYGEPMTQAERQHRMRDFREGKTRVLIATNLLARGIDVQQVSIVFNFDMPPFEDKESYIHRIGRCGRFGRKGVAISLLTPAEKDVMDQIAGHYAFHPLELPQSLEGVTEA